MLREHEVGFVADRKTEIDVMVTVALDLAQLYYSMAWRVGQNMSRLDFIASDRPVAVMPPEGWTGPYGSLMRGATNFFPMSGRTCLIFGDSDPTATIGYIPLGNDEIPEINQRIILRAEKYVITKHERAAKAAAAELAGKRADAMHLLELYDVSGHRSLMISLSDRSDVSYPFEFAFAGKCPKCDSVDYLNIRLLKANTPEDAHAYTQWLDGACSGCGAKRREATPTLSLPW
jgi:hypothetical protein